MSCILLYVLVVGVVYTALAFVHYYLGFFNSDLNHSDDEICLSGNHSSVSVLFCVEFYVKNAVGLVYYLVDSL